MTHSSRLGIYPGSFDPITNGHINIIQRALLVCDQLIVAIADNVRKKSLFTLEQRLSQVQQCFTHESRILVEVFRNTLLVDYAHQRQAKLIIRGLRAVSDFEYEFQMAHMNHRLAPQLDTVFLATSPTHFYLSSSVVKEIAACHGSVTDLVPDHVAEDLKKINSAPF